MLIAEIMNIIHVKYEFNKDYFDATSEEYGLRLMLANDKINMWENEDGILWKELYTTSTGTLDGSGEASITDFKLPANKLQIGDDYYNYVSPELVQEAMIQRQTDKIFTVEGGDEAQTLRVFPNTGVIDYSLQYYKKAHVYTDGTDTTPIEMSDPYFIVNMVVGDLYLDDGDTEKASVVTQIGTQKLEAMVSRNAALPPFHDNKQPDYSFRGFGN